MSMNELQRIIADAMAAHGHPLEEWGAKAWLSRESGVPPQILTNIFQRETYVPHPEHRDAIRAALGISLDRMERAAVRVKGARIYASGEDELVVSLASMTPSQRAEVLAKVEKELRRKRRAKS